MSYADDLAKDRDKYRAERDLLGNHIYQLLDNGSPKAKAAARKAVRKIFDAEAKAADRLLGKLA